LSQNPQKQTPNKTSYTIGEFTHYLLISFSINSHN